MPAITSASDRLEQGLEQARAEQRDYPRQLQQLADRYFRTARDEERARGIAALRTFTDPASFRPMLETMEREQPDVKLAMLDHFSEQGEAGQAAIALAAIRDRDKAFRHQATTRLRRPVADSVVRVVDDSLRDTKHEVVNNAGLLAGNLNILSAIPPMIFAQVADDQVQGQGDLAWIAIGTTKTYVANVVPIVGDNSGAFAPVIGAIYEGVLLRVQDAVAYSYRTDLHEQLVAMTTADFGESTEHLGYDMREWWVWFNTRYVPFKQRQAEELARLAEVERQLKEQRPAADEPPPPPESPVPAPPPAPGVPAGDSKRDS
ncbi:MAG: hypothetical protein FJ253_10790 [Phycisphaerae bacterium]|nr:hypothetical protein [Phycisphaerae bacterium]